MASAHNAALSSKNGCNYAIEAISSDMHQFAESLGNAIDAKDHFTRQHSEEVAVVAHALALGLGLPPCLADHIHIAGHLHDIGKIGIPDAVLQKPGNLTDAEWELVRLHPQMGADIIRPVNFLAASGVVEMVYYHHERWDGKGYPEGLAGDRIPLGSRIIAVADTLSAMLQDRPYREKLSFRHAAAEITANAGRQFDPAVVEAFTRRIGQIQQLAAGLKAGL